MVDIIRSLPNLQSLSLTISNEGLRFYGTLPVVPTTDITITPTLAAFASAARRRSLEINASEFAGRIRVDPQVASEASLGLETLYLQQATWFDEASLTALIQSAALTLRTLSIPTTPKIPLPTGGIPRLRAFSYIQEELDAAGLNELVNFLSNVSPTLKTLEVGGEDVENGLQHCTLLQSLTFMVSITTEKVREDLSYLSTSARAHLRELHISLLPKQSELDLESTFAALPALEELSISGWYRKEDLGPGSSLDETTDIQMLESISSAMCNVSTHFRIAQSQN